MGSILANKSKDSDRSWGYIPSVEEIIVRHRLLIFHSVRSTSNGQRAGNLLSFET